MRADPARLRYLARTCLQSLLQAPRDLFFRASLLGRGLGPIAPTHLRFRVISDHRIDRFHEAGLLAYRDMETGLLRAGSSWRDAKDVLDFGAGCGKLLRWLRHHAPHLRVSTSDVDTWPVAWLRKAYTDVDVRLNGEWPPLSFADDSFDVIVAFSVFTHLDEAHQDAWLAELRRVCRPGGLVLATFAGPRNFDRFFQTAPDHPGMLEYRRKLEADGILFVEHDSWTGVFPGFYHTAFHATGYVERRWAELFDVVFVQPEGVRGNQGCHDLAVLRRRS